MFGKKKGSDTEEKEVKQAKPKKEKKKKEPKEPKPKKEKKEKKPKPKKEKKPKPPKKSKPPKTPKPKKEKKKLNPLILVILLLVVLIIAAAGAMVFFMKQQEKEEDVKYGPMFYFAEEDGIESIRSKIGDREIKGGYTPPVDLTAEEPAQEESEEEKDEEEESLEEPMEEVEEEPELAEVDVEFLTDQHLAYITPENGVEEAQKYMTYLIQEKGFKMLTYPEGSEGEIPKEAPEPQPTQTEEGEETEESEEEEEAFVPPEEGYYIAALDNEDSVEEGAQIELKRIRMDYNYDSYTLRISTANGVVEDLIPPEPEEEKEGSGSSGISISNAVESLQSMTDEQLQLPKPVSEYDMTPIQGRVVLEGIDFFNIRAYEEGPEDTLLYGGTFYVSTDGGSIYKHDEINGDTVLISGEDILAEARQQNSNSENSENAAVQSGNQ